MAEQKAIFGWRAPPDWVWRAVIFLFAVGILILVTTRWNRWESNARMQTTDDAYTQADLTPVAAKVSGYVSAMPVQDFERVRAGQLIVQIDQRDYIAAVNQLMASVNAAAATIEALKAQRTLQAANVEAAKATIAADDGERRPERTRSDSPEAPAGNRILLDRSD